MMEEVIVVAAMDEPVAAAAAAIVVSAANHDESCGSYEPWVECNYWPHYFHQEEVPQPQQQAHEQRKQWK